MKQAVAFTLIAVFASQLFMVLVVPFFALRRILQTRAEHGAAPAPTAPRVRPPPPPMPANDWLASHRLHDMRPALARRAVHPC